MVKPNMIYKLHVLRVAGHVFSSIPPPQYEIDGQWHQAPATVHQFTALSCNVLHYFGPADQGEGCEKNHAF